MPLALGMVIIVQQLVFIIVQRQTMGSIILRNCGAFSIFVFPCKYPGKQGISNHKLTMKAIFLLGNTLSIFGVETSIRSLQKHRLQPRGKWNTPLCLISLAVL